MGCKSLVFAGQFAIITTGPAQGNDHQRTKVNNMSNINNLQQHSINVAVCLIMAYPTGIIIGAALAVMNVIGA